MPRNDVLCRRLGDGTSGWQTIVNANLQMMREAFVNPMPLPYATLAMTPRASNWPGCLIYIHDQGTNPRDKLCLSDGTFWRPLNSASPSSLVGTGPELDKKRKVSFPVLTTGLTMWAGVIDAAFQSASATMTRPWPIPAFTRTTLPDPINWANSMVYVADAVPTPTPWTQVRISNGSKWLPLSGGDLNVDPVPSSWQNLGSVPGSAAISSGLAAVTMTSSGWSTDLSNRFAFWKDLWNKPLPLYSNTRAAINALTASQWKYCLAIVTDPASIGGFADADEFLYICDGTSFRRFRDNTTP